MSFASEVGDVYKSRSHLVSPAGSPHTILQNGRERATIEGEQILLFAERANSAGVLFNYAVRHGHFFIELHADLENFAEVFLILVEELVEITITDEDDFNVYLNRFRLERCGSERVKGLERLNFQAIVIQGALQRAPHTRFRERFH